MANLEKEVGALKTEVAVVKVDGQYTKNTVTEIKDTLDAYTVSEKKRHADADERADKKYASKSTQHIVYGLVAIILTAVAGALVRLVVM